MSLFDKAKEIKDRVKDKAVETVDGFGSDELIADLIMMSVNKQEQVNEILKSRGANYRIDALDIEMGIPPKAIFGIRRCTDSNNDQQQTETSGEISDVE